MGSHCPFNTVSYICMGARLYGLVDHDAPLIDLRSFVLVMIFHAHVRLDLSSHALSTIFIRRILHGWNKFITFIRLD